MLFRFIGVLAFASLCMVVPLEADEDVAPLPNYVPELHLSYIDPVGGERVSCEERCRRFEVPAGVDLEVTVTTKNLGGDVDGHGVPWDIFFDQRHYPFPGLKVSDCQDADGMVDVECWLDLARRVDWDKWHALVADRVCVPEKMGECAEVKLRMPMDENFEGSRGRGVYSLAVWVDRFQLTPEIDEFDNFIGPVRVKVVPRAENAAEFEPAPPSDEATESGALVVDPKSPMPYSLRMVPDRLEKAFNLSSPSSKAVTAFLMSYSGEVNVEVDTGRAHSKVIVQVMNFGTKEVLVETSGKGRTLLKGTLTQVDIKNDRRILVTVKLDQGARPVRGSLTVSYPARPMYRRTE